MWTLRQKQPTRFSLVEKGIDNEALDCVYHTVYYRFNICEFWQELHLHSRHIYLAFFKSHGDIHIRSDRLPTRPLLIPILRWNQESYGNDTNPENWSGVLREWEKGEQVELDSDLKVGLNFSLQIEIRYSLSAEAHSMSLLVVLIPACSISNTHYYWALRWNWFGICTVVLIWILCIIRDSGIAVSGVCRYPGWCQGILG